MPMQRRENLNGQIHFFSRMIEENVLPNEITYNAFINGICRNGKAELAYEYFHQMQEKGLSPNKYTYTLLINANCNLGNWNEALRLYGEMREKGIQPDSCTHSLLFKQYGEDFKCYAVRDRQTKGSSAVQKDQWNLWLRKISGWLGRRPTSVSLAVLLRMDVMQLRELCWVF